MSEELIELAKEMGYDPEYDGDDKKTPAEFIKYGAKIQKNQSSKIKDLVGMVDGMKQEFKQLNSTFEQTLTQQQEAHKLQLEKQRKDIEAKMEMAVDEADTAEFRRLKGQLSDIDKEASAIKPKQSSNKDDEFFKSWLVGKEWINTDPTAGREFQRAIANYRIDNGGRPDVILSVSGELAAAEKHLKEVMPERFGLKKKEEPPAGGPGEGKAKKQGYEEKLTFDALTDTEKTRYNKVKRLLGKDFDEKSTLRNINLARKAGAK